MTGSAEFLVGVLVLQLLLLLVHRISRKWGVLPFGLVCGGLCFGLALLSCISLEQFRQLGTRAYLLHELLVATLLSAMLLSYIHDGTPRVRSLLIGMALIHLTTLAVQVWLSVPGNAPPLPTWQWLAQRNMESLLALALSITAVCIFYQFVSNQLSKLPRVLRILMALLLAGAVAGMMQAALVRGSDYALVPLVARSVSFLTLAAFIITPVLELYLTWFSKLRRLSEPPRSTFDLIWWDSSYRAREHAEEKHTAMLDALVDIIFAVDREGIFREVVNWFPESDGISAEDVNGRNVSEMMPQPQARILQQLVAETLEKMASREWEFHLETSQGTRHYNAVLSPYFDPLHHRDLVLFVNRDVTQKTIEARQMHETAEKLQSLVHGTPALLLLFDLHGRFLHVNRPEDLPQLGFANQEVPGKKPEDLLESGKGVFWRKICAECVSCKAPVSQELEIQDGGKLRLFEVTAAPVFGSSGKALSITVMVREITDSRHSLEREKEIEKWDAMGRLVTGLSHDLNNLLVGIMGHASLAIQNLSPLSRSHLNIEQLLKTAEKVTDYTGQMMVFSGKARLKCRTLDLNKMMMELLPSLQTAQPRSVTLDFKPCEELPSVVADEASLRKCIQSLVANATESYALENGGEHTVVVAMGTREIGDRFNPGRLFSKSLTPGEYVWLEVRDQGVGMNAETMRRCFDPFFTSKQNRKGISLAMLLGIVLSHQGGVEVESHPGKGSRFRIYLPAARTGGGKANPMAVMGYRGRGIALVVDDDESVRIVAEQILQRMGFVVYCAENGKVGIDLALKHISNLSLVLLDMTMPVMSGEETFRGLRLIKPDLRILLSSGHVEVDALSRFAEKGQATFIQKPYTLEALTAKVAEVFSLSSQL